MIDKSVMTAAAAVSDIPDGATIMIGGFGRAGQPIELINALTDDGVHELTIISNNAGNGDAGLAALLAERRVRQIVGSLVRQSDSWVFDGLDRAGDIALEVVPQGNLAERIRAAGAGTDPSSPDRGWADASSTTRRTSWRGGVPVAAICIGVVLER